MLSPSQRFPYDSVASVRTLSHLGESARKRSHLSSNGLVSGRDSPGNEGKSVRKTGPDYLGIGLSPDGNGVQVELGETAGMAFIRVLSVVLGLSSMSRWDLPRGLAGRIRREIGNCPIRPLAAIRTNDHFFQALVPSGRWTLAAMIRAVIAG